MIKVGITELHGIASEYSRSPPPNVQYSEVATSDYYSKRIFRSYAKGVYAFVDSKEHDIIEAPLFPVLTNKPWIYTPGNFAAAGSFNFFGIPTPRAIKMLFAKKLLERDNFKYLLFKSQFGLSTLKDYGGISSEEILKKTDVVYPIVREIPDELIEYRDTECLKILFIGEFIRKGGCNVVDAFLQLQKKYSGLRLTICSSKNFQTKNSTLANTYLKKIEQSEAIEIKFVNRDELFNRILPESDIYICPTYKESWGFSIQEAMAFGKPIIATDINAIPEMIDHEISGILLPIKQEKYIQGIKGYVINEIPKEFMHMLSSEIYISLEQLITNFELRKNLGLAALEKARKKFSVASRNEKMGRIYEQCL